MNVEQRRIFKEKAFFLNINEKSILYSGSKKNPIFGDHAAFVLLKGRINFLDNESNFLDSINNVCFFGHDGPIFHKRNITIVAEKNALLAVILPQDFRELIIPFSKFCTFISTTIIIKEKTLDNLDQYKSFILNSIDKGCMDMKKLLELYGKIDSCLHTKALIADEIDVSAWSYALNRLPHDIFRTYVYVLLNSPSQMQLVSKEIANEIIPKVKTNARLRDIFKYLDGKGVIIVRDLETDVLDFISDLCIHMTESLKIRKMIRSPDTMSKLHEYQPDFDKTFEYINSLLLKKFSPDDKITLHKSFGNNFARYLIDLSLHFNDYYLTILKPSVCDKDPCERWIQVVWSSIKEILKINSSIDEIDDLVVDIIQGSRRTLLGCLSPYLYKNREVIYDYCERNDIKTITKEFLNESDRLLALSFYYFKAFPEKKKEQQEMDKDHGIVIIEDQFSTGVSVMIINPNKLDPNLVDPSVKFNKISENHLIIHIGYTFGAQSSLVIKPLVMLFGSKARSFNVIGKAGGLGGNRTEIMVANKIFYDKSHEMAHLNPGRLNLHELKDQTKTNIHFGPMLTVAGTVIQNYDLLNFYRTVMGCVGIEMEGFFFAQIIEMAVKLGLVKQDFVSRYFYYISDLPLDPTQNLSKEEGNVSWDEGVCSMNAIQRYILNQIFS